MSGEQTNSGEQMLIQERGKKIWEEVKQHVITPPHGNGLGCNKDHILGGTTVKL